MYNPQSCYRYIVTVYGQHVNNTWPKKNDTQPYCQSNPTMEFLCLNLIKVAWTLRVKAGKCVAHCARIDGLVTKHSNEATCDQSKLLFVGDCNATKLCKLKINGYTNEAVASENTKETTWSYDGTEGI